MEQTQAHKITEVRDGIWPVMLTPFNSDLTIDWPGLDQMVDYFAARQVAGFFSICTSSEFFVLDEMEILAIVRRVVSRLGGRAGVVATGNFGATLAAQAAFMRRVGELSVDAVVIATSFLPNQCPILDEIMELVDHTDIPLGLYEAPLPTHRTLTPDEVGRLAATGRFLFFKETSRDVSTFQSKVRQAAATPLHVFQANLVGLINSGRNFGAGFSGCVANAAPSLLRQYLFDQQRTDEWRLAAGRLIEATAKALDLNAYPASAKYLLSRLGVPLQPYCRWPKQLKFGPSQMDGIDRFLQRVATCLRPGDDGLLSLEVPDALADMPELAEWRGLRVEPTID